VRLPDIIHFNGTSYYLRDGYYKAWRAGAEGETSLHRAIWVRHFGPIPGELIVHHRDGVPYNNAINNLELKTSSKHASDHALDRALKVVDNTAMCSYCGGHIVHPKCSRTSMKMYCSESCKELANWQHWTGEDLRLEG
jgi:hypothetical protein